MASPIAPADRNSCEKMLQGPPAVRASQRPCTSLPARARHELGRVTYGNEVVGHMFSIHGLVVGLEGRGSLAGEADTVGELAVDLKWRRRWRGGHKNRTARVSRMGASARERGRVGWGCGGGRWRRAARARGAGARRGLRETRVWGVGVGRGWVESGKWQGSKCASSDNPCKTMAPRSPSPADAPATIRKDLAFSRPHVRHQLALADEPGAVRDDDFRARAATGAGEASSPV